MVAISGAAGGLIRTPTELIIPKLQDFTLNRSPQTTELFTRPTCGNGQASTHSEVINQLTWQADLSGPAFDGTILSLFMDQKVSASASITVPTLVCGTLATAATDVTVTGLTVDQPVRVAFESTYEQETLTQVTTAPASSSEYQITANTVVFFAQTEDKAYRITYTSAETVSRFIGGPAQISEYGAIELIFSVQGLEPGSEPWVGWAPSCTRTGDSAFGTANDTIDTSYKLATPTELGWNTPVLWFQTANFFQTA